MNSNIVYKLPFEIARDRGELEHFRESMKLNSDCAAAIDKAVIENYHDYHFDPSCMDSLVAEYGTERVTYVLARVINSSFNDGRYSQQNKEWARTFDTSGLDKYLVLNSHPTLIDSTADRVRQMEPEPEKVKAPKKKPKARDSGAR